MEKVKVGIIGVGYLGTQHARILSYLEEAELIGVADIDFKKAMVIGNRHGVKYYDNYENMLMKSMLASLLPPPPNISPFPRNFSKRGSQSLSRSP